MSADACRRRPLAYQEYGSDIASRKDVWLMSLTRRNCARHSARSMEAA